MAGIVEAQQRAARARAIVVERLRLGRSHVGLEAAQPDEPGAGAVLPRGARPKGDAARLSGRADINELQFGVAQT